MGIVLSEHCECSIVFDVSKSEGYSLIQPRKFPSKQKQNDCYIARIEANNLYLKADYYIGLDWLIEGKRYIQVKPKVNVKLVKEFEKETDTEESQEHDLTITPVYDDEKDYKQLNYLKLLMDACQHPEISRYTDNLAIIDWQSEQIPIDQEDDALTPFLVVQFLNLLKHIVRKGLKKSYYKVQENLNNRIKGKILVGANIKQNVLKNRLTKTYCEYQQFGIDHQENRFLKKVLHYCSNYVHQNASFFAGNQNSLEQLINYCKTAFELVSDETEIAALKNGKHNPFFKEYKEASKIGQYILKRFAYNISNITKSEKIKTPPFWIDMPKLFELYVYHHLLSAFNESEIKFQFSTYGNALDFLITKEGSEMVVDAKYKMHYRSSHIHEEY
jgi:5-methylcytosine-specific restriction enzyme subunit McrC